MRNLVQHLFLRASFSTLMLASLSLPAIAQRGDVWLYTDSPNNNIGLGLVNEAGTEFTPGVRTLQAVLVPDSLPFSSFEYSAEEPGFRAAAGDLPASQSIALTPTLLQQWNGSGLDPAAGVAFSFDLSGGFSTDDNGAMHEHPLFGLTDLTASPLPIPDGVYVADFVASTAGLGDSEIYRFVMLKDDLIASETDAEDLIGRLEDYENGGPAPVFGGKNFTFFENATAFATIPESTSLALACWGAMLLGAPRRSR